MHINPVKHGYAERAVGWMDAVKKVFGVVLLGVAIWLVSPVMPIMATMLLIGGLLVMCAIFLSAIDPLPCSRRPHLGCDRDLSEIEAATLNHPRPLSPFGLMAPGIFAVMAPLWGREMAGSNGFKNA